MTRRIAAHKGGRTARAPDARMTPECLELLKTILIMRGVSFGDWLEEKVQHEAARVYTVGRQKDRMT